MQPRDDSLDGHAERIVRAARELYYETGGRPFTIQQLASRAGVALRTFYRYFDSKDALLLAVLDDVLNRNTQILMRASARQPRPLLRLWEAIAAPLERARSPRSQAYAALVAREELRLSITHPEEVERAQAPGRCFLAELIDQAIAAGDLPPRANTLQDAAMIVDLVRSQFQRLALGVATDEPEQLAQRTFRFCLAALGAPDTILDTYVR
jgi:TetR/AcrR family transcriptional regulator